MAAEIFLQLDGIDGESTKTGAETGSRFSLSVTEHQTPAALRLEPVAVPVRWMLVLFRCKSS